MKILFCAYRSWALDVYEVIRKKNPSWELHLVRDNDEFKTFIAKEPELDLIAAIGWSWIYAPTIVSKYFIVGMHPSDLPNYAGGSPIQHQILDGITETKASLFRLTPELDAGPVLAKAPLSLVGHMSDIFANLTTTSLALFDILFKNFSALEKNRTSVKLIPRKRLTPELSQLTKEKLAAMSCVELYNFIRCREDPYPNVYIKDATGSITFKLVEFKTHTDL